MTEIIPNSRLWQLDKSEYKPFAIMNHTVYLGSPKDGKKVGSWAHANFNSRVMTAAIQQYVAVHKLEGKTLTFSVQSVERENMVKDGPFRNEY